MCSALCLDRVHCDRTHLQKQKPSIQIAPDSVRTPPPPSTRLETYDFWPTDVLQAFARAGINIRKPPAFARDCAQVASLLPGKAPDILFPADNSVFIRRHGQKENRTIPLQAAADSDASVIYWFVNQALAGQTRPGETLEIVPEPGRVEIQAVDDLGRSAVRNITVKLVD